MTKFWKLAAAACGLLGTAAHADAPPNYAAGMGSYIVQDSARAGDAGYGWHLVYGSPVNRWLSVELNALGTVLEIENFSEDVYQYAFGLDLVGSRGTDRLSFFGLGGVGSMFEDFPGTEEVSPYVNIGAGVLVGLPIRNLKLRGEGRYYAIFNGETYTDEDVQFDAHLNVGLQFSFGDLLKPAPAPAPAPISAASMDDDGDGVPNDRDQCPGTPQGTLVDMNGCPAVLATPMADGDADGDGVNDSIDQCQNTRPGAVVDATGCPIDEDGDGVPNAQDACPHTPLGLKVDERGCAVKEQTIIILQNVHFEYDKYDLTREARISLDDVVAGMKGQPSMQVELAGHTDALGTQTYNLGLSQRRAEAVRNYLVDQGIATSRMHAEGYGEFQPVADNETEEGRRQNRRVEFKVIQQ